MMLHLVIANMAKKANRYAQLLQNIEWKNYLIRLQRLRDKE